MNAANTPDPSSENPDQPSDAEEAPVEPVAADEEPLPEEIAALSYEAARDQLIEVVQRLEAGRTGLEESIALWERGEMLARRCQQWLDGARQKLDEAVAQRR